jgi:hypothetical protein
MVIFAYSNYYVYEKQNENNSFNEPEGRSGKDNLNRQHRSGA